MSTYIYIYVYIHTRVHTHARMNIRMHACIDSTGWLPLVGSLKLQVSCAKEPYKRDDILKKRPVILRSLLIVATPHQNTHTQDSYGSCLSITNSTYEQGTSRTLHMTCIFTYELHIKSRHELSEYTYSRFIRSLKRSIRPKHANRTEVHP